jgi:hypothetical protein
MRKAAEDTGRVIEATYRCSECGFTSSDKKLAEIHSCDVQNNGGFHEDYPACGCEYGDCNGKLYGSDESIKAQVEKEWATGHGYCDHEYGIYNCEYYEDDEDEWVEEED